MKYSDLMFDLKEYLRSELADTLNFDKPTRRSEVLMEIWQVINELEDKHE